MRSMPTVAGKEPVAGFSPQATPVLAQFFEQSGAEHDIAVFAAFSSADMNHHALAVDVADLQVRELSPPQAGSVERHQQCVMERNARGIDESRDFLLAKNGREAVILFRVGCLGDAPSLFERLDVEKPQGRQAV